MMARGTLQDDSIASFREGKEALRRWTEKAREDGKDPPLPDNPYPAGTPAADQWNKGWYAETFIIDREAEEAEKAVAAHLDAIRSSPKVRALVAALMAYAWGDECSNTPDAPDFKPGPHKKCRVCNAIKAVQDAGFDPDDFKPAAE